MKHVTNLFETLPMSACVAFGHFDGMHLGHQAVIEKLCSHLDLAPVLLSFAQTEKPVIYTESEKEYLLEGSGVEWMVSAPAKEMEAMDAETFAREVLAKALHAKTVVVGENMTFGADAKDAAALAALGEAYGFTVETVPTVCFAGEPVSSQAIIKAIEAMDFPRMRELLGRTYIMQGEVVHGKAAGRKHGMPTANLGVAPNKISPPHGVYGTLSHMDGKYYRGMTNIGLRPSDDDIPIPTVETFLLNFDQDIYGRQVILEVFVYIRGVKKFAGGLDEVRKQIDKDIEQVRTYMDEVIRKLEA